MIAERQTQDYEPVTSLNPMSPFNERGHARGGFDRITFLPRRDDMGVARKIEQSVAYMTKHLNQPLQVATLAALANISPSHFFALFKRHTGCAPMDYFTRLRINHACWLLDSTASSVKEVAATLGYDDPFYFSRVFKSLSRVAPRDYRELPAEQKEAIRTDLSSPGDSRRTGGNESQH